MLCLFYTVMCCDTCMTSPAPKRFRLNPRFGGVTIGHLINKTQGKQQLKTSYEATTTCHHGHGGRWWLKSPENVKHIITSNNRHEILATA